VGGVVDQKEKQSRASQQWAKGAALIRVACDPQPRRIKMTYGQNGPQPSADRPGEHTTSGFLPAADLDAAKAKNVQNRTVSSEPYPTSFGMRNRADDLVRSVPGALIDAATDPERQPE
jgi:hypothetical protein